MKALSIKQPWAWLICAGYKDVENRSWAVGRNSRHGQYISYHQADFTVQLPGRIYVHAGKKPDDIGSETFNKLYDILPIDVYQYLWTHFGWQNNVFGLTLGTLIGEVDITGCVRDSESPWAVEGQWHFLLSNPQLYEKPVPCRGRLGFFEPEIGR